MRTLCSTSAALLALVAMSLTPPSAHAEAPCDSDQPEAGVAIRASTGPGELGRTPEACAGTDLTLEAGGALTLDLDDFYGGLAAGLTLHGRVAFDDAWLSLGAPGLRWTYSANASIEATQTELGPTTLGAHLAAWRDERRQLAPYVRFLLPTDTVYGRADRWGVELGAALVWRLDARLEAVFGLSAAQVLVVNPPATLTTTTFGLTADATWRPNGWFALALGLGARVTPAAEPFESFDPRLALRFYPWRGMLIDLSAWLPLGGRDRTTAGALLSLGWAWGR